LIMPYFYYFSGWFVIMFCQIVISPRLSVAGVFPDFVLAAVVLLGLKRGWETGFRYGFVFGLCLDLLNPLTFGWTVLTLSLSGLSAGVIREKIYVENNIYQAGIVAVMAFIYQLLMHLIESTRFLSQNPQSSVVDSLFIALYTAVISIASLILLQQRYRLRELL